MAESRQPPATTTGAESAPPSLRQRVLRAGSLNVAAHGLSVLLRLALNLVMTRLLVPEMFGVMALATALLVVVNLLSDIGLRQAVVHSEQGDSQRLLDTAWTLQIVRGWIIWLICSAVAVSLPTALERGWLPLGSVYASIELPLVIVAISFVSVIGGFQTTKLFTAERYLDIRTPIIIELVSQVCGVIVIFVVGYWTRSIWCFILGAWFSAVIHVALCHVLMPGVRNKLAFDRDAASKIIGYGRWVLMSSIFYVLAINTDRLMLGAWVDAATLGMYSIALTLAQVVEGALDPAKLHAMGSSNR